MNIQVTPDRRYKHKRALGKNRNAVFRHHEIYELKGVMLVVIGAPSEYSSQLHQAYYAPPP